MSRKPTPRCAGVEDDTFFPERTSPTYDIEVSIAKSICATCPVKRGCLKQALADGEQYGVWGGLSEEERVGLVGSLYSMRRAS